MWLAELGAVDVDHTWLWWLNPHHGPTLEVEEYADSVRLRLGYEGPTEPAACAACQSGLLDSGRAGGLSQSCLVLTNYGSCRLQGVT